MVFREKWVQDEDQKNPHDLMLVEKDLTKEREKGLPGNSEESWDSQAEGAGWVEAEGPLGLQAGGYWGPGEQSG